MKLALSVAGLNVGGIAIFVLNLSRALREAGHEVLVIARRHGEWWPHLTEIGVDSHCLPRRRWDSLHTEARRFAAYVVAQQVDLLVVNIGIDNRIPMYALHRLPDSLPVALVLHNHRPEVYDLAAVNAGAWNCAVGVSAKIRQTACAGLGRTSIHLIPCGIALPPDVQVRERLEWSLPVRLLFVGRLDDHQKGILRLPSIVALCRQRQIPVRLTVIGDGPDRDALVQGFQTARVADLVELLGEQSNEAVLAQMRVHHVLLQPSNFEGFSIVLQEAQANGCVPIVSDLKGITDSAITDGVNGRVVEPTDIPGFIAAIQDFQNEDRWRCCSQAGIVHARKHYSIQHMTEQYMALFDALGRGEDALPLMRSTMRQQGVTPFVWRDYLPQSLRSRLRL